jgi:ribosome-binding protein aMBF1 (putative translation factor)
MTVARSQGWAVSAPSGAAPRARAKRTARRNGKAGSTLDRAIDRRVARRIRERRQVLAITQKRLAEMIGVAFQQLHKYERGLSRVPAGRLYHIATALDTPIAYFFSAADGGSAA